MIRTGKVKIFRAHIPWLVLLVIISACVGGSDNSETSILEEDTTWEFADFDYRASTSSATVTEDGAVGVILVSTTDTDITGGDYSGSAVTITFTANGHGSYEIVSGNDFTTRRLDDPSAKLMVLSCTVGTIQLSALSSTRYDSVSGGTASVSIDPQGRYHFSVSSPIGMTKTENLEIGVLESPEINTLKLNNVYDFSNGSDKSLPDTLIK